MGIAAEVPSSELHPLLLHHAANDLGWPALRPVQQATILPIRSGENLVVVAPTAGGKTEAAFFPLLSDLAETSPTGLSVLYLSPIRALLNNQVERLRRYFGWLGCTVGVWHGDVGASERKRIRRYPPTCLMTTPESLESILCSTLSDPANLFREVRAVVVDELHAFGDSDRGWHMLAVLHRIASIAGTDIQRIGLSATVGNLGELRDWLCRGSQRPRSTVAPPRSAGPEPEVMIDAVGTVENAAKVISKLHRGEKRLAFCDSRLQVEQLSRALRELDVTTFVTHSSLSVDERRQAERAFSEARDCVIVATSALELGIDVGDLDRVIQLDAPSSVASFLQRMGRTGRRPGTTPNCLFLTTRDLHLVQAAAVVNLWKDGYVEPVQPPPLPLHLLVQQALALLLQRPGLLRSNWRASVSEIAAIWSIPVDHAREVLDHLEQEQWVVFDGPAVLIGPRAEEHFGSRHFMDLLSVFETQPVYEVLHGNRVVGDVHAPSFSVRRTPGQPLVLSLGGRAWRVTHVDHRRRRAHVEPDQMRGRSRWLGGGAPTAASLAAAMRDVLVEGLVSGPRLSRRAQEALAELVEEHRDLGREGCVLVGGGVRCRLWTFSGSRTNDSLADQARHALGGTATADALQVRLPANASIAECMKLVSRMAAGAEAATPEPVDNGINEKFGQGLALGKRHLLRAARGVPQSLWSRLFSGGVRVCLPADGIQ